jgi:hypothetical protein
VDPSISGIGTPAGTAVAFAPRHKRGRVAFFEGWAIVAWPQGVHDRRGARRVVMKGLALRLRSWITIHHQWFAIWAVFSLFSLGTLFTGDASWLGSMGFLGFLGFLAPANAQHTPKPAA